MSNDSNKEHAKSICWNYKHLAGAILGFILLEYLLFQIPFAMFMVRLVYNVFDNFFVIMLGGFVVIGGLVDHLVHKQSIKLQYAGLALMVLAEVIIFMPLLFIAMHFSLFSFFGIFLTIIAVLALFVGLIFKKSYQGIIKFKNFPLLSFYLSIIYLVLIIIFFWLIITVNVSFGRYMLLGSILYGETFANLLIAFFICSVGIWFLLVIKRFLPKNYLGIPSHNLNQFMIKALLVSLPFLVLLISYNFYWIYIKGVYLSERTQFGTMELRSTLAIIYTGLIFNGSLWSMLLFNFYPNTHQTIKLAVFNCLAIGLLAVIVKNIGTMPSESFIFLSSLFLIPALFVYFLLNKKQTDYSIV